MGRNQDILDCLAEGTEGCLTLVGSLGMVPWLTTAIQQKNNMIVL
jgi:hypothetical protein